MLRIEVHNAQSILPIAEDRLRAAAETVLAGEGVAEGELSLAIVDNARIHAVNREFLEHDYPTDVISFRLDDQTGDDWEGEIVASAEYAHGEAQRHGWHPGDELLLYIVHGTLHLVGYDDLTPEKASEMRRMERHYLERLGTPPPPWRETECPVGDPPAEAGGG